MRKGVDCKGVEWEERELSSKMRDRSGEVVGSLTILFPVKGVNRYGVARWLCQCECGNQVVRQSNSLQNGVTQSCGCLTIQRRSDAFGEKRDSLIGEKFNKLTIIGSEIKVMSDGSYRTYYKCLCDCGNKNPVMIRGTDVVLGKVISCGCARRDAEARKREDLTGKRFGKLTVEGFAYIKNQASYWNCKCDCGNIVIEPIGMLNSGHVLSCGCLNSIGELHIIEILNKTNIEYLHNKGYFKDLLNEDGNILRYDFILFDHNHVPYRLIEFDGPKHDTPNSLFGEAEFQRLQIADDIKNQYALSHNIPLVRIPYSKRDTMCLEDILGNKYLIKGDN